MPYFLLNRALNRAPCLFLLFILCVTSPGLQAENCLTPRYDETVTVKRIVDGDTLQLLDGRKLRLIGINTPELNTRTKAAEPLAHKARQYLLTLTRPGRPLKLRWGTEKKDRYGRLLAHGFNSEGRNLSAALLAAGMGAAIQIPPNLWAYDCYLRAENNAHKNLFGIWSHAYFNPLNAHQLATDVNGFHFVRGRLSRVGESKSALWLNLGDHFALRIPKSDLAYFNNIPFKQLIGRQLTARGWVYSYQGQKRINLHHPGSLEIGRKHE